MTRCWMLDAGDETRRDDQTAFANHPAGSWLLAPGADCRVGGSRHLRWRRSIDIKYIWMMTMMMYSTMSTISHSPLRDPRNGFNTANGQLIETVKPLARDPRPEIPSWQSVSMDRLRGGRTEKHTEPLIRESASASRTTTKDVACCW